MVNFKWKKEDGKLTEKAKAYLRLTYKNQYSTGIFYNNKERVEKELTKQPSQKSKILSRKVKQKIAPRKPLKIPKERIRKQRVMNLRSGEDPYAISIRVITINPEITNRGLERALYKVMQKYQGRRVYLEKKNYSVEINFKQFYEEPKSDVSPEKTRISINEDRILNDYEIHYEILIERNKAETGIV